MFFSEFPAMLQDIIRGSVMICLTTLFFVSIFAFFAFLRYLRHKETMAMLEKGLLRSDSGVMQSKADRQMLQRGVLLVMIGLGICISLYPIGYFVWPDAYGLVLGPWMIFGIIPLFVGVAMLIIALFPALQAFGVGVSDEPNQKD